VATRTLSAPAPDAVPEPSTAAPSRGAGGDVEAVVPVLEVFGTVPRRGPSGSGAALKAVLVNAMIGGVALVGGALALGDAPGLPEDLLRTGPDRGPLGGLLRRAWAADAPRGRGRRPGPPDRPPPLPRRETR
jgi:hypothetical protein